MEYIVIKYQINIFIQKLKQNKQIQNSQMILSSIVCENTPIFQQPEQQSCSPSVSGRPSAQAQTQAQHLLQSLRLSIALDPEAETRKNLNTIFCKVQHILEELNTYRNKQSESIYYQTPVFQEEQRDRELTIQRVCQMVLSVPRKIQHKNALCQTENDESDILRERKFRGMVNCKSEVFTEKEYIQYQSNSTHMNPIQNIENSSKIPFTSINLQINPQKQILSPSQVYNQNFNPIYSQNLHIQMQTPKKFHSVILKRNRNYAESTDRCFRPMPAQGDNFFMASNAKNYQTQSASREKVFFIDNFNCQTECQVSEQLNSRSKSKGLTLMSLSKNKINLKDQEKCKQKQKQKLRELDIQKQACKPKIKLCKTLRSIKG